MIDFPNGESTMWCLHVSVTLLRSIRNDLLSTHFSWPWPLSKWKDGGDVGSSNSLMLKPIGSMYGIYANIGGILMVNVTIYSIHGSYGKGTNHKLSGRVDAGMNSPQQASAMFLIVTRVAGSTGSCGFVLWGNRKEWKTLQGQGIKPVKGRSMGNFP